MAIEIIDDNEKCNKTVSLDKGTRDLARELAYRCRTTMKDVICSALLYFEDYVNKIESEKVKPDSK